MFDSFITPRPSGTSSSFHGRTSLLTQSPSNRYTNRHRSAAEPSNDERAPLLTRAPYELCSNETDSGFSLQDKFKQIWAKTQVLGSQALQGAKTTVTRAGKAIFSQPPPPEEIDQILTSWAGVNTEKGHDEVKNHLIKSSFKYFDAPSESFYNGSLRPKESAVVTHTQCPSDLNLRHIVNHLDAVDPTGASEARTKRLDRFKLGIIAYTYSGTGCMGHVNSREMRLSYRPDWKKVSTMIDDLAVECRNRAMTVSTADGKLEKSV